MNPTLSTRRQNGYLAGVLFLTLALLGCPGSRPSPQPLVDNPIPSLSSLSPSTVSAGGGDFTLTVNGSGFVGASVVRVNGADRTTTFVSGSQLQATITAADIAAVGSAQITVFNPAPGGGTSSALTLTITLDNPAPNISFLSPSSITAGGGDLTLTVNGSDFVGTSVVRVNGVDRTTTFVSSAQLQAAITAADIAVAGTAEVTVFNPAPGGGTSNALAFTIAPSTPGTLDRMSLATDGTEANASSALSAISADGRFVAFASLAGNLVSGDDNGVADVFVHDTCVGAAPDCTPSTVRVSVASDGTQGDSESSSPAISADGRFIAFDSFADNLVAGDTNGVSDIFLRDTCFAAPAGCSPSTVRVSVASDGTEGSAGSTGAAISADGRFLAFESFANNLVAGDTNGALDIFVHDRDTDGDGIFDEPNAIETVRVSTASDGTEGSAGSTGAAISADGRFLAFESFADNLVAGDTNGALDIFVHDRDTDGDGIFDESNAIETVRVSTASDGTEGSADSGEASISANAPFVSFTSNADNLVANDTNGVTDVFVAATSF